MNISSLYSACKASPWKTAACVVVGGGLLSLVPPAGCYLRHLYRYKVVEGELQRWVFEKSEEEGRGSASQDMLRTFWNRTPYLFLDHLGLTNLPGCIGKFDFLKNIGAAHNKLSSVPAEVGRLKNLEVFSLQNNRLTEVPARLFQLPYFTLLDISNNQVSELPASTRQSGIVIHAKNNPNPNLSLYQYCVLRRQPLSDFQKRWESYLWSFCRKIPSFNNLAPIKEIPHFPNPSALEGWLFGAAKPEIRERVERSTASLQTVPQDIHRLRPWLKHSASKMLLKLPNSPKKP